MTTTYSGFGNVSALLPNKTYVPIGAVEFTLTSAITTEDILGRPLTTCGAEQIVDTITAQEIYTLTLGAQKLDRQQFDLFAFGAERDDHASIVVPAPSSGVIDVNGEIANTDLTADQANVYATVLSDTEPGNKYLTQASLADTLDATNFQVDAGKIVFNSTYAGSTAIYYYYKTLTNQLGIGGNEEIAKFASIEVFGTLCGSIGGASNIYIPLANNISGINMDATADTQSREFRPVVDTARGYKEPFFAWS